jgi:signal transduction histidine kinase
LRIPTVLILSDDPEFTRVLTACWQGERHVPAMTALTSDLWRPRQANGHDLTVVGPVRPEKLDAIIASLDPCAAVIWSAPGTTAEAASLRTRYPQLVQVPLREDWAPTLVLVAGEVLRRVQALKMAQRATRAATENERHATLGRYMSEMKHSVSNALTSILGNAELLMLEPGQLSGSAQEQLKTIHRMALRLSEIMQRFSSLATEMWEVEKASQAETEELEASHSRGE